MPKTLNVLFVCIGNSCRSPIAEAVARHTASDVITASSAGISPLGRIQDSTRKVLLERGITVDGQFSKSLHDDTLLQPADLIINMSGYRGESLFAGRNFEDWEIEDPYGEDMETYRRICDDIEARVADLAARLRAQQI
ncbi:MAG TPA: low molecular weight phosphatase family protein [Candidatus Limnocylindria bacterium]|nr:low molecular weight phosphatase family protein [Candidatus Limnocylindria bacterium]